MTKRLNTLFAVALTAAISLLPCKGYANEAPSWINDTRRAVAFPTTEWFVGFSVTTVGPRDKIDDVRKQAERDAQNNLAQSITVQIQSKSESYTGSSQLRAGSSVNETVRMSYDQSVQTFTDMEVAKVDVDVFHDQANNTMYAFARVRKADLVGHYSTQIESFLQNAENSLKLARQHAADDRKRNAQEELAKAKKNLGDKDRIKYDRLLSYVDYRGDLKRLRDRASALGLEIAAFETKLLEAAPVYVSGVEKIDGNEVDILVPMMQDLFSQNGCRVVQEKAEAEYVLTVTVRNEKVSTDKNFTYCYANIRSDLVNTKTKKSEAKLNFTGPKASWTTRERACQNALLEGAKELWKRISTETEVCFADSGR